MTLPLILPQATVFVGTTTSIPAASGQIIRVGGSSTVTITLPAPSLNATVTVVAAMGGAGGCIVTAGASIIFGSPAPIPTTVANLLLGLSGSVQLVSDGTYWYIVSSRQTPPWTGLAYATNFGDIGGALQVGRWMKDTLGFIHIEGSIAKSSAALLDGDLVATLPAGARPAAILRCPTSIGGVIEIASSGTMTLRGLFGSSTSFDMASIIFQQAN